ncbi:MAG TPA: hypothetical protein VEW28_10785 [Candidatus Kapabacteria bacterium]|nr:hypothetical protein [Candidatus Kapabacteria bacterium]
MTTADSIQFWIALVALYAAVLSTISFVRDWREKKQARKDKERQLKITIKLAFIHDGNDISDPMIFINVSNPGNRTVNVNLPSILLPNGSPLILLRPRTNVQFPYDLEEGKNFDVWVPFSSIASQLRSAGFSGNVKLIGQCRDGVDNLYQGEPFTINLE